MRKNTIFENSNMIMKKISILLLVLFTSVTTLSAANPSSDFTQERGSRGASNVRMEWGLTACVSYNTLNISKSATGLTSKPHIGYGGGLNLGIKLGRFLAIQPEINYIHSKIQLEIPGVQKRDIPRITTNSVDIPLLISLRFTNIFRINAGPVFTVMNNCFYTDGKGEKLMFGNTKPTFGYSAGVAIALLRRYMIDVRYVGYFKPSLHNFNSDEFNGKYQTFAVKIGYLF